MSTIDNISRALINVCNEMAIILNDKLKNQVKIQCKNDDEPLDLSVNKNDTNTNSDLQPIKVEPIKKRTKTKHLEKCFDTLNIKCMEMYCDETFTEKEQMLKHMMKVHRIRFHRCLQRNCTKSYNTTQYSLLYRHVHWTHHQGMFQCRNMDCKFIGSTRGQMYAHSKQDHNLYGCDDPNCEQTFRQMGNLRRHQRKHLRVKPYGCLWTNCQYRTEFRSTAINHIRTNHLKLPRTVHEQKRMNIRCDIDPRQYLTIDGEQLKLSRKMSTIIPIS
ncbi:hypothetical protein RDWZM_006188 [Blomia tropicalis]|uniref:C2H2-type domain-containing protein n=1 Tax=Blomia tropicalis TaxID=40697 RepID=A0A9Q0RP40_BLOTA|nr:hypothetical protein RDWZM_006188 [Blomia tropicalis]